MAKRRFNPDILYNWRWNPDNKVYKDFKELSKYNDYMLEFPNLFTVEALLPYGGRKETQQQADIRVIKAYLERGHTPEANELDLQHELNDISYKELLKANDLSLNFEDKFINDPNENVFYDMFGGKPGSPINSCIRRGLKIDYKRLQKLLDKANPRKSFAESALFEELLLINDHCLIMDTVATSLWKFRELSPYMKNPYTYLSPLLSACKKGRILSKEEREFWTKLNKDFHDTPSENFTRHKFIEFTNICNIHTQSKTK